MYRGTICTSVPIILPTEFRAGPGSKTPNTEIVVCNFKNYDWWPLMLVVHLGLDLIICENSLTYLPPVQILNHRFTLQWITYYTHSWILYLWIGDSGFEPAVGIGRFSNLSNLLNLVPENLNLINKIEFKLTNAIYSC